MNTPKDDPHRAKQIRMIQVAKRQLALDDDAYRAILQRVTGKTSSTTLSWVERMRTIEEFKRLGFKTTAGRFTRGAPVVVKDRQALIRKMEAQLAEADYPWSYADTLAKRICKVDRIEFCQPEHLSKIIAALSYDAKRHGRNEE